MPEVLWAPSPPTRQPCPHACAQVQASRTEPRGHLSAPAIPRVHAPRSTAGKQDLSQGSEGGEGKEGARATGARAWAGVRVQLRSCGSHGRPRRAASQRASPPEPQYLFSINCLRDPLAGGFLSNTVFYKLRRQQEDATAVQRLPTSKKCQGAGAQISNGLSGSRGWGEGVL